MRRLVGILRDDQEPAWLTPQPGRVCLHDLVEQSQVGGLAVTLTVTGAACPLPAGLELSVYRIVQEALTNVRRHAGASHAYVHLTYTAEQVTVEVSDNGHGGSGAETPGHGLIGMRERAAMYGGQVQALSSGDRGFTVRAAFPVAL